MICPKCHTKIADGTKFCTHCGCNLNVKEGSSNDISSKIIFVWVLVWGISNLLSQILVISDEYLDNHVMRYICYTLWGIANISYVLIPFSVKNRTIKIISLGIVIPIALWFLCRLLSEMLVASY